MDACCCAGGHREGSLADNSDGKPLRPGGGETVEALARRCNWRTAQGGASRSQPANSWSEPFRLDASAVAAHFARFNGRFSMTCGNRRLQWSSTKTVGSGELCNARARRNPLAWMT